MYVAICDDEYEAVEQVEKCLDQFRKSHKTVKWAAFFSGEELLSYYKKHGNQFDVLITDIEMDKINGIELANTVRNLDSGIVIFFLSSHDEYLRQCFKPSPANFWDKPMNYEQFKNDMEEAFVKSKVNKKIFSFKENSAYIRLSYKDIIYFSSYRKKLIVHTLDSEHEFYGSCSDYESQWYNCGFIKVNRGCYINTEHIVRLKGQEIILKNNDIITVSRTNMKVVKNLFNDNGYEEAMKQIAIMGDEF